MDETTRTIRSIGRNLALETGIRVGLSLCARLLLGYLGGLPATALSVNAAIAFLLSAALELPAGMLADAFGARRSVRLGYACQAAASLSLFGAIALRGDARAMWALIVAEAVFDALGNAFLSGARESAYQAAMESLGDATSEKDGLRQNYLLFAEAYGRRALVVVPLALTAVVLWLDARGGRGHFGLLLVAACWIALDRQFQGIPAGPDPAKRRSPAWRNELRHCLVQLRDHGSEFAAASFCWAVNRFSFIVVVSYFALAVIMDKSLWPERGPAAPAMALTIAFLAGRLARSYILPALASAYSTDRLILSGAAAQVFLGIAVLAAARLNGPAYLLVAGAALACYDVAAGMIERPCLGLILKTVPEAVRASFLSILSMIVLAAQGAYSLLLIAQGRGAPPVPEIWLIAAAAGALIFASRLRPATSPLARAAAR